MYWGIHVKCPTFLPDWTTFEYSGQIIPEDPNIKFRGNPSSGSRADTWEQTGRHDKANGALCDYAKAPKIMWLIENWTAGREADSKVNLNPGRKSQESIFCTWLWLHLTYYLSLKNRQAYKRRQCSHKCLCRLLLTIKHGYHCLQAHVCIFMSSKEEALHHSSPISIPL
jgi:hypothetical protein